MTGPRRLCPACRTGKGDPKRSYDDEAAATQAMRSLAADLGTARRLNVYPCPKGHGWHVGHRPGTLYKDLKRLKRQQGAVKRAAARGAHRRHRR